MNDNFERRQMLRFFLSVMAAIFFLAVWNSPEMVKRAPSSPEWARPVLLFAFESKPMEIAALRLGAARTALHEPAEEKRSVENGQIPNADTIKSNEGEPSAKKTAEPSPAAAQPTDKQQGGASGADRPTTKNPSLVAVIGDSFSNGYARAIKTLAKKTGIDVFDGGRHSTGLSIVSYHDWPSAMDRICDERGPGFVVIALGANDAQDIRMGGRNIRFASPEWKEEYLSRSVRLASNAAKCSKAAYWLSLPPMRDEKYEKRMAVIRDIQREAALLAKVEYLESDVFGPCCDKFDYNGTVNGRKTLLRASDGTHLTPDGYSILARLAMEAILGAHRKDLEGQEQNGQTAPQGTQTPAGAPSRAL